jgi:Pectate lyase superfamily protein
MMLGLTRRGLLTSLAASAANPGAHGSTSGAGKGSGSSTGLYTSVKNYGAVGNGKHDDTHAIRTAISAAPSGGTVWFPSGIYRVSKTIVLRSGCTYRGSNAASSVIQQADNTPGLAAVVVDENYIANRDVTSQFVQIEDLTIDGNSQNNKLGGHGLVLMAERSLVRHLLVTNTTGSGIVLADQNSAGRVCDNNAVENRIEDCTILQPGQYGIWVMDTHASGRQTDGYLINNVVANCSGKYGMYIERAAGWFISNNHVYHSSQNGIYMSHVTGTFFYCNEVDKFGLTSSPPASYYGLQIAFEMGRFRPSVFIGNLCATPEGKYPYNTYTYYQFEGDKFGQSNVILVGNVAHNDLFSVSAKAAAAETATAFRYDAQPGGTLNLVEVADVIDGIGTTQAIPGNASVNLSEISGGKGDMSTALAAGVGGGAVVAGLGIATLGRQARRQVDSRLAMGYPAPSYRDPVTFIDAAETLNRWEVDPLPSAPDTGTIHVTYFVPYRPIEVSHISSATGDVAAAGAQLSRVGIYEVLDTGELRLLGATRNRPDRLWTEPNAISTSELDPAHGSVPLLLLAGKRYAYAEIQVGGSPAQRVGRSGNATLMALEPRASARYRGYSDLQRQLPAPSGSNNSGLQLYARLSAQPGAESGQRPAAADGRADGGWADGGRPDRGRGDDGRGDGGRGDGGRGDGGRGDGGRGDGGRGDGGRGDGGRPDRGRPDRGRAASGPDDPARSARRRPSRQGTAEPQP